MFSPPVWMKYHFIHYFVDTSPLVDSSLQAKQRQLKRARLQDSLSDALANRPGPLDLVKNKILQVDPQLQGAIQGKIKINVGTYDVILTV